MMMMMKKKKKNVDLFADIAHGKGKCHCSEAQNYTL